MAVASDDDLRPVAERGFLPNLKPLFDMVRQFSPVLDRRDGAPAPALAEPLLKSVVVPSAPGEASAAQLSAATENAAKAERAGLWGPTLTTCSATLGAGALSLPFAMSHLGMGLGLLLLALAALATHYSITLLVSVMDATRLYSYEELTVRAFGRWVGVATEVAIISICFGSAIAYSVAVADILMPVLKLQAVRTAAAALAIPAGLLSKQCVLIALWATVLLPLSLIERLSAFEASSLFGVCSLVYLVLSVCVHAADSCARDPEHTYGELRAVKFTEHTPSTVAILVFAFTCQVNVPSIYQDMQPRGGGNLALQGALHGTTARSMSRRAEAEIRRSGRRMYAVSRRACAICFVCYALIGAAGYANFPHSREPNILSNYDISQRSNALMAPSFLAVALTVLAAYPLNIFPCRYTMDVILQRTHFSCWRAAAATAPQPQLQRGAQGDASLMMATSPPGLAAPMAPRRRVLLTLLITGLSLVVALYVPGINVVFQLMGGTASAFVCLVLPAALALRQNVAEVRSTRGKLACLTLGGTGVAVSVLSTVSTVAGLL